MPTEEEEKAAAHRLLEQRIRLGQVRLNHRGEQVYHDPSFDQPSDEYVRNARWLAENYYGKEEPKP